LVVRPRSCKPPTNPRGVHRGSTWDAGHLAHRVVVGMNPPYEVVPATQGSSRARPSTSAPKKAFEEQECGDLALSDVRQPVEGKLLFIEGVRGPGAVWTLEFRRNGPVPVQPAGAASAGPGLIVLRPREITLGS
jgi:hypothetical protein